jgi:16S rRNA (adenine(1408)-N(1))-methyltransferase
MREASDRASRKPARGGVPNAIFLAGTLEEIAALGCLAGAVTEVRVTLPWGSLLRAAAIPERTFLASVAALIQPGGRLQLLLSVTERDSEPGLSLLSAGRAATLAREYEAAGFTVAAVRPATAADVESSGSSWAKRLGVAMRREAWLFETFVGSRETPARAVSDTARD